MKTVTWIGLLGAVLVLAVGVLAATPAGGSKIEFTSLDPSQTYRVSGTLYLPDSPPGPVPAVVMIHGTARIDQRGEFYRQPLLTAGIAIFEVDFKTGIYNSALDRPRIDTFVPLAFAALKQLRKLPAIGPNRIGIMGFSMGGNIGLRTALESNVQKWLGDEKGFAAFALFYPVCRTFVAELQMSNSKLTGRPMIVFYGTKDSYGEGDAVPQLKTLLADKYNFQLLTVEYPGATHGFNRNAPPMNYPDPAAIGGRGYMAWDPAASNDSVNKVVSFLKDNLAGK